MNLTSVSITRTSWHQECRNRPVVDPIDRLEVHRICHELAVFDHVKRPVRNHLEHVALRTCITAIALLRGITSH